MNAVMIYNDSACAAKARVILERAAHRANAALPWTVKPWRLDLLMPSLSADAALTDAADAHLMLLVLRHSLSLPASLQNWLSQWASRRLVQDAALALWDGGNGDTLPAATASDLSRFAGRHGLSFIFGGGKPAKNECTAAASGWRGNEKRIGILPRLLSLRLRDFEPGADCAKVVLKDKVHCCF
jgi:hypothetical protein